MQRLISEETCILLWELRHSISYSVKGEERLITCFDCKYYYPLKSIAWSGWKSRHPRELFFIKDEDISCEKLLLAHCVWNCLPLETGYEKFKRQFYMTELISYSRTAHFKITRNLSVSKEAAFLCCASCSGCICVKVDDFTDGLCTNFLDWRWKCNVSFPLHDKEMEITFQESHMEFFERIGLPLNLTQQEMEKEISFSVASASLADPVTTVVCSRAKPEPTESEESVLPNPEVSILKVCMVNFF